MSLNQEVFLHNLEVARRKAGSVANLMGALDGTNMTYYGWKKKVPKNLGSKLVTNLANYLGTTPEKIFMDKLTMPTDIREETPGLSLSRFLEIQEELKALRKKHTWSVMNYWFEKFDQLLTKADDDIDGLRNLIQILKPPMREKENVNGSGPESTGDQGPPQENVVD
jgi:hypothetical protein